MTVTVSNPFKLNVTGAWTPPYTLPINPGDVVFIGTNTIGTSGLRPSVFTATQWEYAIANTYGGGALCEDYSQAGAFVFAGTGGHTAPPNLGACLFDFQDATWKRIETVGTPGLVNNMPHQTSDYVGTDTLDGVLIASSPPMPAPSHQYSFAGQLRTSQGGGPKGSYLLPKTYAQTTAIKSDGKAFKFDLATGVWSRLSTNETPGQHRAAVFDPVTNRFYVGKNTFYSDNDIPYLDLTDMTYKTLTFTSTNVNSADASMFLDHERRILVLVCRMNTDLTYRIRGLDIDAPTGRIWTQMTLAGDTLSGSIYQTRWAYYPDDGCYYTHKGELDGTSTAYVPSGQIFRLQPPVYNGVDKFAGTWTVTELTLGTLLPPQPARSAQGAVHNTRFFYVPSINRLAWISGRHTDQVALIKPPSL